MDAVSRADGGGLDAVGLWDHLQAAEPEFALLGGWSAFGAFAAATNRIRLTPTVASFLNHALAVLAKESATLAIVSGGRFALKIGAGAVAVEPAAWGRPHLSASKRVAALAETGVALRRLWTGAAATMSGEHACLTDAASRPPPLVSPRIIVGAGASRRLATSTVAYADEINIHADRQLANDILAAIAAGRPVDLSASLLWGERPADAAGEENRWAELDVARVFVHLCHPFNLVPRLLDLAAGQLTVPPKG